jgi:4-hydroxybenzoate polyprenyltransferase
MKNSKLLFILLLLTGIGILLLNNPFLLFWVLFCYIVFCILEPIVWRHEGYGNGFYEYSFLPRKYNIIAMFIDWIDSFPQIIKKK